MGNTNKTKKPEKKLGWLEKQALKRIAKKQKKLTQKIQKIEKYKTDPKLKNKLEQAIWTMRDGFDLYHDEEGTIPLTQQHLKQMTNEELTKYLEEIIEKTKIQI